MRIRLEMSCPSHKLDPRSVKLVWTLGASSRASNAPARSRGDGGIGGSARTPSPVGRRRVNKRRSSRSEAIVIMMESAYFRNGAHFAEW